MLKKMSEAEAEAATGSSSSLDNSKLSKRFSSLFKHRTSPNSGYDNEGFINDDDDENDSGFELLRTHSNPGQWRRRRTMDDEIGQRRRHMSAAAIMTTKNLTATIIQCLLPNGIILDLSVNPDVEMASIKQLVLNKATTDEQLPLRGSLSPDDQIYQVSYISTSQGKMEEVYNEKITLRELKPFDNLLRFSKRSKSKDQYVFRKELGDLIGKDLKDFEELRNCEVNDFRWRSHFYTSQLAQKRRSRLEGSWKATVSYHYQPRLATFTPEERDLTQKVRLVWGGFEVNEILINQTPEEIVRNLGAVYGFDPEYVSECCLKIVGEEAYLLGNQYKMIDYQYILEKRQYGQIPKLVVIHKDAIGYYERPNNGLYLNKAKKRNHFTHCNEAIIPSKEIKDPFSLMVESLKLKNGVASVDLVNPNRILGLQMGLYHGAKPLCQTQTIFVKASTDIITFNEVIKFNITVSNLPRMAKLCIGIFEKKGKSTATPLMWVNTSVFDYKAQLRWTMTLQLWNYCFDSEAMPTHETALSPLRQPISNPNIRDAANIVLSFINSEIPQRIEYQEFFNKHLDQDDKEGGGNELYDAPEELEMIADRDPLHEITEQEKELIWNVRGYCRSFHPQLLPRIIDCVDYANADQIAELHDGLLERWPLLSVERSLQLLDYAYPDEHVRKFAVRCLRQQITDEILLIYLLQLVQALKHEMFLQCDLVEFLLERALNHQHIGHYLFWHLKAEMKSPTVSLMFGLILEAYLSAAPEHCRILQLQNRFLDKCKIIQGSLQKVQSLLSGREKNYDRLKAHFKQLTKNYFLNPYQIHEINFLDPLNPSIRCKKIKLEGCRVMNSKMRPLMLAFENADLDYRLNLGEELEDIVLLYKKGDDLRQDMLILQLLKVMDMLWKNAGLDLRLTVYRCLSTGVGEGFIEVVQNCETICEIQMAQADIKATAAFKRKLLLSWLKKHNPSDENMERAQWEFTQSCAGYSVATYILGIGDRHNDNIMLKRDGKMFHIDFGHFLGNFKHKFGIKRERVAMTLSAEFVEVIKADFGENNNFERFRELCERAYLTIRRHGSLIISLLAMMISTGLPELNSEQDLNIVRNTLHLDMTEEKALEQFRKTFDESLSSAWSISVNWWFHMMNQLRN